MFIIVVVVVVVSLFRRCVPSAVHYCSDVFNPSVVRCQKKKVPIFDDTAFARKAPHTTKKACLAPDSTPISILKGWIMHRSSIVTPGALKGRSVRTRIGTTGFLAHSLLMRKPRIFVRQQLLLGR